MKRPQLVIAPGKEKAILRRHPWIFSGAVKRIEGDPQEGDLVDVVDSHGQWLAAGHYQNESIICKVLTFDADEAALPIEEILRRRIHSAVNYRVILGFFGDERTNVFRLVHAEGDYLPGLVADWYNGVLVLQAHSVGMHRLLPVLAELFVHELQTYHGYPLRSVFDKSSATVPGGGVHDGIIWGEETAENEVLENGIRLTVNFYEGQKTGFFIDQRENRALVQQLALGRRLLNCFGYTGGFSLAALKGGADYVETVDISKKAIELCNRNVELNFGVDAPHKGTVADVLQFLNNFNFQLSTFNFIILDPPAFAKNHRSLQQGLKGYRSINQRAMEKIAPGGLLMTFSCSQAVSKEDFQTMVFTAAMNAGRRVRIVRQLPHAMDHPVSIHHPEGEYLKGLLLQVE
ncbi:MAG: class I SAM-dependent rRNA methyltransferase [Bacteroidales bacterium]|nr:class I SAM-dependent rRNA methyltransferase [Bacteroidales bacterium]